jgi:transposase
VAAQGFHGSSQIRLPQPRHTPDRSVPPNRSPACPNKATVSVAHSILVAAWYMLSSVTPYNDLGPDWFSSRRDPECEVRRLVARLQALGHNVSISPAA